MSLKQGEMMNKSFTTLKDSLAFYKSRVDKYADSLADLRCKYLGLFDNKSSLVLERDNFKKSLDSCVASKKKVVIVRHSRYWN